jgi:tRNA pseudouridine38-40 synthase
MASAAEHFLGEHDFGSFCRSVEGRSNVRNVDESQLRGNEGLWEYWIRANAFCHQMVRSIVGHIYDVGRGFAPADLVPEVIAAADRGRVATVAPPHGLTLWDVGYPDTGGR